MSDEWSWPGSLSRPTHEAAPPVVARAISDELVERLGGDLEAVIGHGSWIHGDFCPGRSDLDLLVVLRDEPDPRFVIVVQPILEALTAAHPAWADRLELGFVTSAAIQSVLDGDETRVCARVSPGEPLHLVPADPHRLLDWEAARRGTTVHGKAPAEAIPYVGVTVVREVVKEHLGSWPTWQTESNGTGFQAYAVLTVCRAAAYLTIGDRLSKREGAAWAEHRFPESRPLIRWAEGWWYGQGSEEDQAPAGVEQFVAGVVAATPSHPALRPMLGADLDRVLAIQEEGSVAAIGHLFPQNSYPFPRSTLLQRWTDEIAAAEVDCFVIEGRDHKVQGFAATRGDELLHFGTARETWGSGLARRAHDELLDHLRAGGVRRARLRVFEGNSHARRFYEQRHWRQTDQRSQSGSPPYPLLLGYERDLS